MQIQITGQGVEITPALKELTHDKLSKLKRHNMSIMRIHIVFSVEKLIHHATAELHLPGHFLHGKSHSENMYKTVDLLVEKLDRQVRESKKSTS
tara:strand:+ start:324 stop:605 length:282 start_codon:yes stop_codon:yes gene_type:complete